MKQTWFLASFLFLAIAACQSQSGDSTTGFQDLDVAAFKAKMSEPGIVLLDVRTPEETAQGKIEGAVELDYNAPNFEQEVAKLDKDKTYLVYCRSGGRSSSACEVMHGQGFTKLYNLKGGYMAWSKQ
ncbi:MAG: rhodanese-like domain-containing protein [Lewinellaceae bacterium]|nr:rhodanese-like domain-containing protein [Lewinellaceae bacterium]